jgi:flagellar protein FliO/FliZ
MDSTVGTAITGLLGTVIALAVVLGLAWLTLRGLRQWQDRGTGGRGGEADHQLRFIRALPVGQRERLMLVEARGEIMLIGISAGSVSLLRNWGDIAPADLSADPDADVPPLDAAGRTR